MMQDIPIILWWWGMLFVVGLSLFPITATLFSRFTDKGYIFSKIFSVAILSYLSFFFGILHLIPFSRFSLLLYLTIFFGISYGFFYKKLRALFTLRFLSILFLQEILFLIIMTFWVVIRGFNPEIHGLEKYMDFGFMNSILRSDFFPPKDMWFTPYSINYYYFGHLYSSVLTKISGIPQHYTYNLLLGTVAAFCFTSAFSLGINLLTPLSTRLRTLKTLLGGLLCGALVTFSGNLHTLYTLFKPYENEHPVPFWQLIFSPLTFPNGYWYPNATRFIYNTIHEFPIYSWVVADLHGHVLDIPFVLLTIALLFAYFTNSNKNYPRQNGKLHLRQMLRNDLPFLLPLSIMLSMMYMTNAWDGLIYLLLTGFVILGKFFLSDSWRKNSTESFITPFFHPEFLVSVIGRCSAIFLGFVIFSLPFSIHFKPFVSGIGVLCAPNFLTKIGHFGPLLFEANHCQHSPWWQILVLYGFFFFFIISIIIFLRNKKATLSDTFIYLLILLSLLLILIPEFIYVKDIYPAHYRANTMFKLVFQSFIMLSIVSGYTIVRVISNFSLKILPFKFGSLFYLLFILASFFLLTTTLIYPYFAVMSYYNNLTSYKGIHGTKYLYDLYPEDYAAIQWINTHIKGQPVILEAQSDSYTDYGRVSTNTGLPTVLGWTVHEWLWRGEYDYQPNDPKKKTDPTPYYPAPRIIDVQKLYESDNVSETKALIKKYNIEYVFLGDLERAKYTNLNEEKWNSLGKVIYRNKNSIIYKLY